MLTGHVVISKFMLGRWPVTASMVVVPLLATVSACSDDGSDGTGDGVSIPHATSVTAIPPGAALIDQDNLTFIPRELAVPVGGTVYLKNSEAAVHTVTIDGKNVSGVMREDDTLAWIPPGPGSYRVACDYHPQMRAMITVK